MLRTSPMKKWTRSLLTPSLVALVGALFALPAPAATVVFNPVGTGNVASDLINVSQFTYNNGSALAVNGNQAVANFLSHTGSTTFTLQFQSVVGIIGGTGAGTAIFSDQPIFSTTAPNTQPTSGPGSGDVLVSPVGGGPLVDTHTEFTTVGTLTEQVTGVTTSGGSTVATFSLVAGGTNTFAIYAVAAGSANESLGTGFSSTGATPGVGPNPILTGSIIPASFSSGFNQNGTIPNTTFDQYSQTAPPAYSSPFAKTGPGGGAEQTISGGGTTQFLVSVTTTNSNYFLTAPTQFGISLNPVSAVIPFQQAPPAQSVNGVSVIVGGSTASTIGTVNGASLLTTGSGGGPDTEFQTGATLSFTAVPEPGTMTMALTVIGFSAVAGLWTRRRRSTPLAG